MDSFVGFKWEVGLMLWAAMLGKDIQSQGAFYVNSAIPFSVSAPPPQSEAWGRMPPPRACPAESSMNPSLTDYHKSGMETGLVHWRSWHPGLPEARPTAECRCRGPCQATELAPCLPNITICKVTTGSSSLGTVVVYTCGPGLIINSVPHVFKSRTPIPDR